VELLARLAELDWDPLAELYELSKEARAAGDLPAAIKANASILNYVYPKRRSIDVTGDSGPLKLVIATGVPAAAEPVDSDALLERLSKAIDH
jgi:hypothetical protein